MDSNKQLVSLNDATVRNLRKESEKRKILYHYCSLSTLEKILSSKYLLCNNLNNFKGADSYEKVGISNDFLGIVFISCLSFNKSAENLWEDFADNKKGAKITFTCDEEFHSSVLDITKKVKAYSANDTLVGEFGFNISSITKSQLTCNPNFYTPVFADISLSDVLYTNEPPTSTIKLDEGNYLNISNISKTVLRKFDDEYESRLIVILRSTEEVCLPDISYLLLPLDFSKFKFDVEFGRNAKSTDVVRIKKIIATI